MMADTFIETISHVQCDERWEWPMCMTCYQPTEDHQRFCSERCRQIHAQYEVDVESDVERLR